MTQELLNDKISETLDYLRILADKLLEINGSTLPLEDRRFVEAEELDVRLARSQLEKSRLEVEKLELQVRLDNLKTQSSL